MRRRGLSSGRDTSSRAHRAFLSIFGLHPHMGRHMVLELPTIVVVMMMIDR